MNTSMMQQIVNAVGTCVTAGAGKILVSKIAIILSKSNSAAALKTAVMSIIKKIGITTIANQQLVKPWQWLLRLLGFLPMQFSLLY